MMGILFEEFCCQKQGFWRGNHSGLCQMRRGCLQKSTNTKLLSVHRLLMTGLISQNSQAGEMSDTVNVAL